MPAADAKLSQVSLSSNYIFPVYLRFQEAMNETFLLSNIAPQIGDGFNRHCTFFVSCNIKPSNVQNFLDWAYLEDWCRRLTGSFQDVFVFTVPLYLPRLEADGKWRVVSLPFQWPSFVLSAVSSDT